MNFHKFKVQTEKGPKNICTRIFEVYFNIVAGKQEKVQDCKATNQQMK